MLSHDNNVVIRSRSNKKFCEPVSRAILFCEAWGRYERKYRESKLQFTADNTRARTFNAISSFLSATHRKVATSSSQNIEQPQFVILQKT